MSLTLSQLEFCRTVVGEALLAVPLPKDPLAAVTALRSECAADQAAAVMELRRIRQRACKGAKLPEEWATRMLATDTLFQQASSLRLAVYLANQLAPLAEGRPVADLCCGMGVDAIGLALAGMTVAGWDLAEQAVLCATHNAGVAGVDDRCQFAVADVTQLRLAPEDVVHVDPDRRPTNRRRLCPAEYSPPERFLRCLPARTAAGAIKLSPAVGFDALADWEDVHLEYVGEDGVCKQLLVWWSTRQTADPPSPPARKATVVFGQMTAPQFASLPAGRAPPAPLGDPGPWLLEPDPAVVAAGAVDDLADLLARTGHNRPWRVDRQLAWLFSDQPADTPLARSYRILRTVPGRQRDVAQAVAELDGGVVQVKPRGLKLDTDDLQRRLRGQGDQALTVLWGKVGPRQQAFIGRDDRLKKTSPADE